MNQGDQRGRSSSHSDSEIEKEEKRSGKAKHKFAMNQRIRVDGLEEREMGRLVKEEEREMEAFIICLFK